MLNLLFSGTLTGAYEVPPNSDRQELVVVCTDTSVNPVTITDELANSKYGIRVSPGGMFILNDGGSVFVTSPLNTSSEVGIWEVS